MGVGISKSGLPFLTPSSPHWRGLNAVQKINFLLQPLEELLVAEGVGESKAVKDMRQAVEHDVTWKLYLAQFQS